MVEGLVDAVARHVTVKEVADLFAGKAVLRCGDGFTNAVGDGITGRQAEEAASAFVTVGPNVEGGLEMRHLDDFTAIEGGEEGAETEDLGLAAAGGRSAEAGTMVAEMGIAIRP